MGGTRAEKSLRPILRVGSAWHTRPPSHTAGQRDRGETDGERQASSFNPRSERRLPASSHVPWPRETLRLQHNGTSGEYAEKPLQSARSRRDIHGLTRPLETIGGPEDSYDLDCSVPRDKRPEPTDENFSKGWRSTLRNDAAYNGNCSSRSTAATMRRIVRSA